MVLIHNGWVYDDLNLIAIEWEGTLVQGYKEKGL